MILDLPGQQQLVLRKKVLPNMTQSKQKTMIHASSQIHIAAAMPFFMLFLTCLTLNVTVH